jgi:ABC-type branched-subunit amino acid transport system ATPase component
VDADGAVMIRKRISRAKMLEFFAAVPPCLVGIDRLGIFMVDHVMQVIMNISDRVTVLNFGRKIAEGGVDEVRADPEVQRAYLGGGADHAGGA